MSLSEFDKQTVELIPSKVIIPNMIELPQYQVEESRVSLEYINKGNVAHLIFIVLFKKVISLLIYVYKHFHVCIHSTRLRFTKLNKQIRTSK